MLCTRPAEDAEMRRVRDGRSVVRRLALLTTFAFAALLPIAGPAAGATPGAGWTIQSFASPTHFAAGDELACVPDTLQPNCDNYSVTVTNSGSQPTDASEVVLEDTLPAGLSLRQARFFWPRLAGLFGLPESRDTDVFPLLEALGFCTTAPIRCKLPFEVAPDEHLRLQLVVALEAGAEGALTNRATVSGGGAAPAQAEESNQISAASPLFGPSAFANLLAGPAGAPETQAGAHPYELTTTIGLASVLRNLPDKPGSSAATSVEDVRDVAVDLPLGFLGSALAAPQCRLIELSSEQRCPPDTRVGHITTEPDGITAADSPIWNITPEHGVAAEFGYIDALNTAHLLYASVAPGPEGYVLRTTSPEIPQISLTQITTNFYGDPAARAAGRPQEAKDTPFFTNPAACDGKPLLTHIHLDSWQSPGARNPDGSPDVEGPGWASATSESPPVTGCDQLQFHPTIEATPETNRGDSPTGLEVTIKVPQNEGIQTLATPPLKRAVVTLPEGMTVNPSSANGLQGCSLAELGISASGRPDEAVPHCPDASKLGTVELRTPLLAGALQGQIYLAKQTENPFNSLLALYVVVDDPTTGLLVKIPGEVRADPTSGQLQAIFDNSPQFPFSELRTRFFGGQRAALRTPAVCGQYTVTSSLTPWSAPESGPPATPTASFNISQGCSASAGAEPNKPAFRAGTETPLAGAYSPLGLELSREDGSQELSGLNLTLPPGLIGKLAGISECSEAQLAAARSREALGQGGAELASPSCPLSSEVGTVTVGAGAGLTPYYATGHAYLAGPYKGAPLSLAVITPAVAGPFDLGSVVIRNALQVDPFTAQITAVSDSIPHILQGIPLDIRSIALNMTRHQFTLNPTNCEKKAVTGEATSVLNQIAPLSSPFQVGGCKALPFSPKLKLNLKGGTKRNKNPALRAVVTEGVKGEANVAHASVALPHSEFLDQAHIGTVCTRVQFAAGVLPGEKCPAASVYGFARAITPLLDQPLEGPVYLRSSSNKLPDLVASLRGQIDVVLDGRIDTDKADGIRTSFETVPDAEVSKFVLEMKGGKKGLLVNSENICAKPQHATAKILAQNGKNADQSPLITNSCAKKSGKGHKHKHRHRGKR